MSLPSLPNEVLLLLSKSLSPKDIFHLIQCDRSLASVLTKVLEDLAPQGRDGVTALQWAARNRHEHLVRLLLKKGVDVNTVPSHSLLPECPLQLATIIGDKAIVKCLLDHGADVNCDPSQKGTALHLAIKENFDEQLIKLLLKNGANVEAAGLGGDRPLHLAVSNGIGDLVRLLLGYGADIDSQNETGETALFHAVKSFQKPTIRLLLENGANPNSLDEHDMTALHWAVEHCDVDTLRLLLEYGANVNATDFYGRNALMYAQERGLATEEVLGVLLAGGAHISITASLGLMRLISPGSRRTHGDPLREYHGA